MTLARRLALAAAMLSLGALAACSGTEDGGALATEDGDTHDHSSARVSLPVGDGTESSEVGYSLRHVTLPERAGEPGRLGLVVEDFRGRPQTRFLVEQTKTIHVYVVRDDLAVFRHVHPEMGKGGRWTTALTLPEAGDYRVVVEFVARDDGGNGDRIVLGDTVRVPGDWSPSPLPPGAGSGEDWGVRVEVLDALSAGAEQTMRIRVATPEGGTPRLGTYLGTSAHLTGFHDETGGVVHLHPLGAPDLGDQGAELAFHAEMPTPGRYLLFVQVRVDEFLHTVPVPVDVAA